MPTLELIGRQSSHYTRVARMLAHELGVDVAFTPIFELMSHDPAVFAGNPALKLPILCLDGEPLFGTLNICRMLARAADAEGRVCWPETVMAPLLLNAHELVAHAMAAQVEVVMHEIVEKRPPDSVSKKRRDSLVGGLRWLDSNLPGVLAALPPAAISWFELCLYCLLTHLPFRNPLDLSAMPALLEFERQWSERPSAQATPYRFDGQSPVGSAG